MSMYEDNRGDSATKVGRSQVMREFYIMKEFKLYPVGNGEPPFIGCLIQVPIPLMPVPSRAAQHGSEMESQT